MLRGRKIMEWLTLAVFLAPPWSVSGAEPQRSAAVLADMAVGQARIDWLPQMDYEHLTLTVAGPESLWIRREFKAGQSASLGLFDAKGAQLPDGDYTYELRLIPRGVDKTPERPLLQAGSFAIRDGSFAAIFETGKSPEEKQPDAKSKVRPVTAATQVISEDFVVQGNAAIGPLCTSSDPGPQILKLKGYYNVGIKFEDVFDGVSYYRDWLLQANPNLGGPDHFFLQDLDAGTIPFSVQGNAPDYSLVVATGGNVGVGTATPGAKLHLYGSAAADAFASAGPDPATGPAFNFGYGGASYGRGAAFLNARPDASATAPNPSLRFATADAERMIITNTGNVGIGTNSPSNSLHVKRSDGTAQMLVEETSSTAAWRTMAEWTNNGGVQLNLTDRNAFGGTGVKWSVQNVNAQWRISDVGDSTLEMVLDQAGNVTFAGTVTPGSSRTIKEQFSPVDPHDVLRRVVDLPITTWSYKATPGVRHLGPMSEDFFTAFSVGTDDKGISVTDSAGVALAAIQALYLELAARDAQIATLRARVEELAGRLEHQGTTPK